MFNITNDIRVGGDKLLLLSGPCIVESPEICFEIAGFMKKLAGELGFNYVFKASFDKANRTSGKSFRGTGMERNLEILAAVKKEFSLPIVTDVHEAWQVEKAQSVADILQIPAFLCRQTDLLLEAGRSGLTVNIKKGQFMAPEDMAGAIEKVLSTGNKKALLTERGTTFGYHNLVVDMRSLVIMKSLGVPVVFDATHSVQLPGGLGSSSGGQREFAEPLTLAASAVGIDGLFMEVHPEPSKALSDGPNSLNFEQTKNLLKKVKFIYESQRKGFKNQSCCS